MALPPLPPDAPWWKRSLYKCLLCPPHGYVAHLITLTAAMVFAWLLCLALVPPAALPYGSIFSLFLIGTCGYIGGEVIGLLRLPALLGVLLMGMALKNIPEVRRVGGDAMDDQLSSVIRQIALVNILIRAGLNLDPVTVWKLKNIVLRLSIVPCVIEATSAAIVAYFLLGFPWIWAFMLGFVMSAVSPAVVVPSLLAFQERKIGTDKGIPTIGIAASSVNQILAICVFSVLLGAAFAKGSMVYTVLQGPIQLLVGLIYGLLFGVALWIFPSKQDEPYLYLYRSLLLGLGGLVAVLGGKVLEYSGAGALGCLLMAFVAGIGWRKEDERQGHLPVAKVFTVTWDLFQVLLFALIGAKIDFSTLDPNTVWQGIICIIAAFVGCGLCCFLLSFGQGFTIKERIFFGIAWMPKATVQAAIGAIALDTAKNVGAPVEDIERGEIVLAIAVITILITAPIGALAIAYGGPRLLQKEEAAQKDDIDVESVKETGEPSKDIEPVEELDHASEKL